MARKPKPTLGALTAAITGLLNAWADTSGRDDRMHTLNTQIVALQAEVGRMSSVVNRAWTESQEEVHELRRQLDNHNAAIAKLMADLQERKGKPKIADTTDSPIGDTFSSLFPPKRKRRKPMARLKTRSALRGR